jgi:hypothetical protein
MPVGLKVGVHVWYDAVHWENGSVVRSMGVTCKAGELECAGMGRDRGRDAGTRVIVSGSCLT